jgi:predicted ATPase
MAHLEPSYLTELRLTSFKSFRDATLPLEPFALVIGRNGSGKSNALDGLWVLSQLASGGDVRDSLEGGGKGPAVRGGVIGCAPFGETSFSLGASVQTGSEVARLDVTVQVDPVVQLVHERLTVGHRVLFETDPPNADSADIVVNWDNRKRGPNPKVAFRASRLVSSQVLARIPATAAGERIHRAAARVLAALSAVFVLDPIPHQMRQYVPRRDVVLRRGADNLSAAVAALLASPEAKRTIMAALDRLNEQEISDIAIAASALDDVMLTLHEGRDGHAVSARLMSDGSLRFLAVLVALMQAPTAGEQDDDTAADAVGQTTMVIEELENGLHASQAVTLVELIREQVHSRRVRALATAHSPALLDALRGDEHGSVVVCQRDEAGGSRLRRLIELPDYFAVVAGGTLGRAATADRLRDGSRAQRPSAFVNDLLGETSR